MKKERTIKIKNPQLTMIRNGLRTLLNLWVDDQVGLAETQKEKSRLRLLRDSSICSCPHCGYIDKDIIYRPDMGQWLCTECNSEFVYFSKLRVALQMDMDVIIDFFRRLDGEEGINIKTLPRLRFNCGGQSYPLSKRILDRMGIKKEVQKQFFELCQHYGGFCDCEILFNTKNRFTEVNF